MADITTKKEAKKLLSSINENTKYEILLKKDKDKNFMKKFVISRNDIIDIIKSLDYSNVQKKIKCEDKSIIDVEYLFAFKANYSCLDLYNISSLVHIYIKIGQSNIDNNVIVVVSLHEDEV